MQSALGLIGLAVMGQNLALNIADNGFALSVYNRTVDTTKNFVANKPHANITACFSNEELVASLTSPRIILLMVQAGKAVDDCIAQLVPLLEPGDIIIDGGNSHFADTQRRYEALQAQHLHYVGMGISGGELGARFGPSIMPGGDQAAWPKISAIFTAISAKVDNTPCCAWIGDGASGHYVKMVHNGIEYGDMQLITEAYAILRHGAGLTPRELQAVFSQWNLGVLNSYLIEITADILTVYEDDELLLDKILDSASQKGTGKWTVNSALDHAVPLTLISEAVFARHLSAQKALRVKAASHYQPVILNLDQQHIVQYVHDALYAAKIMSYTQGFMLLQEASNSRAWQVDYAAIARLWRGGCIIRSQFLNDITRAFEKDKNLPCLIFDDYFKAAMKDAESGWRKAVSAAISSRISVPAMSSALAFFDGLCTEHSPANLLQAQRDYFGAHTYQRVDKNADEIFHTDWANRIAEKE